MSKPVPVKTPQAYPSVHKSGLPMAEVREVTALQVAVPQKDENGLIVAYKDLNENGHLQLRKQKQQMLFAFSLFLLIGMLILAGQVISKPRMVASTDLGIKVEGTPTHSEHYQYEKNCYKGENGEQVCVTRTSRK